MQDQADYCPLLERTAVTMLRCSDLELPETVSVLMTLVAQGKTSYQSFFNEWPICVGMLIKVDEEGRQKCTLPEDVLGRVLAEELGVCRLFTNETNCGCKYGAKFNRNLACESENAVQQNCCLIIPAAGYGRLKLRSNRAVCVLGPPEMEMEKPNEFLPAIKALRLRFAAA